jgi:hypothetical protein
MDSPNILSVNCNHCPEFDLENAHYGSLEAIRGVDFA